jgi:hypothetical protein
MNTKLVLVGFDKKHIGFEVSYIIRNECGSCEDFARLGSLYLH